MLKITIPAIDMFDDIKQEFIITDECVLELRHSLISLSKWESTWEKPFLGSDEKTTEEVIGYVKAMTLTPDVPAEVYSRLSNQNYKEINEYIDAKMSATWFRETSTLQRNREIITSELIYYWMVTLNVPMQCEEWHLSRLFTFIKVCNEKNQPEKKISPQELAMRNKQLNDARKAKLNTTG